MKKQGKSKNSKPNSKLLPLWIFPMLNEKTIDTLDICNMGHLVPITCETMQQYKLSLEKFWSLCGSRSYFTPVDGLT